jgi:ferric-chelate reductase
MIVVGLELLQPCPISRTSSGGPVMAGITPMRRHGSGEIELVWTAKQSALLRDIARRVTPVLAREVFQASLYTTGASIEPPPQDLNELGCTIQTGRPHLQSLIMSRACDVFASYASLVILACGPAGMADEARTVTHLAMRQGDRSIKYVEDSFAW